MIFVLFSGGVFLTLGDILMKRWVVSSNWHYGAGGMLVWMLGLCCLAASMKSQNIAIASVILVFFNVATLAIAEWFLFHNTLSVQQLVGLGLGAAALVLLETAA